MSDVARIEDFKQNFSAGWKVSLQRTHRKLSNQKSGSQRVGTGSHMCPSKRIRVPSSVTEVDHLKEFSLEYKVCRPYISMHIAGVV